MRTAAAAVALAAAACLASRGAAEPCAGGFEPLAAEVALRAHLVKFPTSPEQRDEKRDLARAGRLLSRGSRSYVKDARTAGEAGSLLLARYPGDGTMEGLVDGAFDGLRSDVGLERDDLALTAGRFPVGEDRDRAEAGVAEADAALALHDADGDLDAGARGAHLEEAAVALDLAFRDVLAARGRKRRRTCGNDMWVAQPGLLWRADRVTGALQLSSGEFFLDGIRIRTPVGESELRIDVSSVFGTGTYPLGPGSGLWVEGPFRYYGIVDGGSLTIDALDEDAGTAEGTFSFTAHKCLFDCAAYEVTGGSFRLRRLVVQP
jgi:hypothetical protein